MTETAFWKQPAAALLAELGTTDSGLTSQEAALRLLRYGSNDAAAPKRSPAWLRFIRLLANPLVIILLVASALSAATGDVASFVIIASIVLLSVLLDFAQASQAQSAVDALRQQVALRADVRRDGAETSLPVVQLVPGDIVRLTAGDMVPADGVLLSSRDFFVNQALLTGESFPVEKHAAEHGDPATEVSEAGNVALAGTSVIAGSAVQLICQTGRHTTLGQLAATLIAKPPPTSFEIGLRRFSMLILRITLVLVLLVMAESMAFHRPWMDALIFALALAVGLTPELLPMIMTITLARGAVRLSHQRVIVKSLPAIHNLGAMDVLCTDKTGTLTEARIALTRHRRYHRQRQRAGAYPGLAEQPFRERPEESARQCDTGPWHDRPFAVAEDRRGAVRLRATVRLRAGRTRRCPNADPQGCARGRHADLHFRGNAGWRQPGTDR